MTRDETVGRLGIARPSYARMCVRTTDFFVQIADEMGEWWMRTQADHALTCVSDWRLVERRHMEDAAVELLMVIRGLPRSVRDVVERRSAGRSWTAISRDLPDRAYFSLTDDWSNTVRLIRERHEDLIRRIV